MEATVSLTQSDIVAEPGPTKPSFKAATIQRINVKNGRAARKRPIFGKRGLHAMVRFLITFCIGVAATLAWQSYGGAAREESATYPQLGLLAPKPSPSSHAVLPMIAEPTPTIPSRDPDEPKFSTELEQVRESLATLRQSIDQIVAGQEQITHDIANLQTAEQDILRKIGSTAVPAQRATAARRPAPPAPLSQAPPAH